MWFVTINNKLEKNFISGLYVSPSLEEEVAFTVFLYTDQDKLVLTDVDGTITASDIEVLVKDIIYNY